MRPFDVTCASTIRGEETLLNGTDCFAAAANMGETADDDDDDVLPVCGQAHMWQGMCAGIVAELVATGG